MQLSLDLISKVELAIQNHDFDEVKNILEPMNDADIAELIKDLSLNAKISLIRYLPNAAYILEYLSIEQLQNIVEYLPEDQLLDVISGMHSDNRIDLFKILSPQQQQQIYQQLSAEKQQQIRQLE